MNPDAGTDSALKPIAVARLPQVVDATDVNGVSMTTLTKQGYPDLPNSAVVLASSDPSTLINVPRVFEGRRADPRRATEAMIDVTYAAKTGLKAGSELTLYWPRDIQHAAISPAQGPPPSLKAYPFRVAGVVVDPFTVSSDEGFQSGYIFLTAAFWKQHPETSAGYWGEAVRLRRGAADIPAFRQAVEQLVPDESIAFQTLPVTRDKTQRAIRPYADALAFFAFAVAVAGLLLVGQSLSRQLFVDSSDHPVLYAIGFTRSQLFALGMLRAAMVGITGAAIACGIGAAASALFPIGPGRLAEPTPGPMIDGSVLLLGAAAVIVVVLLLAVAPAWRGALAVDAAGESSPSVSRVAGALARSGAPAPAIVGIRLAMEPGRGRTAVPVRTTIGAAAGLTHLANTPRLYGWNWNVLVETPGEGPGPAQAGLRSIEAVLANDRLVGGWTRASISEVILNGRSVVSVGIETVKGRVHPTLAAGRIPRSDDEVALGSVTMRHLGVSLGDTVAATYGPVSRTMKIVGRVVLPGLGNYPGADKTALGEGAVLTRRTALELGPGFGVSLFVQFRPGVTVA
ncbi:MAG: FtsX-like permease family protein [Actinobacteria bacterium]|nr:MAG: FtsX-like permease family protein [Actinomycetota bacterium]